MPQSHGEDPEEIDGRSVEPDCAIRIAEERKREAEAATLHAAERRNVAEAALVQAEARRKEAEAALEEAREKKRRAAGRAAPASAEAGRDESAAALARSAAKRDEAEANRIRADASRSTAEAAKSHGEDELRYLQRYFDEVFHAGPIGFAFFDRDLRFLLINERLAAIDGPSVAEHLGRRAEDVLSKEVSDVVVPILKRVVEMGDAVLDVELPAESAAEKERRWYSARYYPVRADDQVSGVSAIVQDITERKEADAERAQRRVLEMFMGILGHDLRNPVNAILLSAAALLREGRAPEENRRTCENISKYARRVERMIEQLLDLTRARVGGGIPIERQRADLSEICTQIICELEDAYPGAKISKQFEGDTVGHWDPDRVAQVVSNLVGNALQYGSGDRPVEVCLRDLGARIELTVSNSGEPISPDVLRRIFDPFYGGPRSGTRKGLGLGLYITREIIVAHGGTIVVDSSGAASGTKIRVELPRAAPS